MRVYVLVDDEEVGFYDTNLRPLDGDYIQLTSLKKIFRALRIIHFVDEAHDEVAVKVDCVVSCSYGG